MNNTAVLTDFERQRYLRQISIDQIGEKGQIKIKNSKVIVIGCGGLGSPVAAYLAACGVGMLGLCDYDVINISNLQRQILYSEEDIGKSKVEIASKRLNGLNREVTIVSYENRINEENIDSIIMDFDIVIDSSDNYETRYTISDACVRLNKIDVYAAVYGFAGQVMVLGKNGPCLRCINPKDKTDKLLSNVFSPICGVIGSLQALTALKIILGEERELQGKIIFYDGLSNNFELDTLKKNSKCFCSKK